MLAVHREMAISVRLGNEEQTSAVHKCEESVIKYSYGLGNSLYLQKLIIVLHSAFLIYISQYILVCVLTKLHSFAFSDALSCI